MKSITNTKTKIWIGIDMLLSALLIYLFLFVIHDIIFIITCSVVMLYRIKWKADTLEFRDNTVQIRNWFTTTRDTYELDKIDNYVFSDETLLGKRLLLVSANYAVAKIRYKNYSNVEDILGKLNERLKANSVNP
ncbi:MAG: hypothetical protein QM762_24325 [Chryseolinea sp.]